jgi:hypothetical protein
MVNIQACANFLHNNLSDPANLWEQPIGLIVPRNPHFNSLGDGSKLTGGAYFQCLLSWFNFMWSPKVRHAITDLAPSNPGFVHIKGLEFVIVLLQLGAIVVRLNTLTSDQQRTLLPDGLPAQPVLVVHSDNTSSISWSKVSSKFPKAQQLIALYAEVLCLHTIGLNSKHIQRSTNICADDISQPSLPDLSPSNHLE